MKRNLNGIDRGIRILGGLTLVALTLSGKMGPLGGLGAVAVLAGILGWCPVYRVLDINTHASFTRATRQAPAQV